MCQSYTDHIREAGKCSLVLNCHSCRPRTPPRCGHSWVGSELASSVAEASPTSGSLPPLVIKCKRREMSWGKNYFTKKGRKTGRFLKNSQPLQMEPDDTVAAKSCHGEKVERGTDSTTSAKPQKALFKRSRVCLTYPLKQSRGHLGSLQGWS